MLTVTCLILLVPLCQSSHAESSLPELLFITEELRKTPGPCTAPGFALIPLYSSPACPKASRASLPRGSTVGTRTRLRFLPGNRGCSTGSLGCIPVEEFLGDGVVRPPSPVRWARRGWGEGVPISLIATGTGGGAAPRQSFPVPTGFVSHNMGLRGPSLTVLVFVEDEPPQQLFLPKLVLESNAGCSGGAFSLWGDFSDVEDSSKRKYNYSLRFSRNKD